MAVYILSALLIIILAFAIYQLSKASEVEAEIKKLKKRNQLSLMEELRAAEKVVWLCFTGGLLLTANYAITYFSGSELVNIPDWSFIQWSGAFIGLVVAVSITFIQKVLYSSPTHSKAGLVVTTLVLTFVIISEIGAPIEKEGMKMKEASQNSAVFKAVVSGITSKTDAGTSYSMQIAAATAEKAQHEFELQRCERHTSKGEKRVKRCEDFENKAIMQAQAKIDSYQSSANTTTNSNENSRLALIQQAKALEHNTDNHSELVKLTASILGANFLDAMMFLSLVLIVAFEAGFHFVGSRVGLLKTALGEMGNKQILRAQELATLKSEKRFKDKTWNLKGKQKGDSVENGKGYTPATALQSEQPASKSTDGIESLGIKTSAMKAANEHNYQASKPTKNNRRKNPASVDRQGVSTGDDKPSSDPADRVSKTLPTGLETKNERVKNQITGTDFDELYKHVKTKINEGEKLSVTNMRKIAHSHIKDNPDLKNTSLSIPETSYLVDKIRDKMINENFIIDNPDYTNGKAKYLLAGKDKT